MRKTPLSGAGGDAAADRLELRPEPGDPGPGQRRDREDGRVGQERAADEVPDRGRELGQSGVVDEVALGQGDDAELDVEEPEDVEVLPRLHGQPLVGGDDEQGGVDVARARGHGLDELLVARDVDEDDLLRVGGVVEEDEAQLDGHAAGLFLGQGVRVGPGQGPDEGALAVVDVAGRADDDVIEVGHVRSGARGAGPEAEARLGGPAQDPADDRGVGDAFPAERREKGRRF